MRLPFSRNKAAVPAAAPRRNAGASATPAAADDGPVELARTQARRRLIGAVVLLAAGVIGLPMLFETQPRPLPVDTPILLPPGAVSRPAVVTGERSVANSMRPVPALPPDAGTETAAAPGAVQPAADPPPVRPSASATPAPERLLTPAPTPAPTSAPKPAPKPAPALAPASASRPSATAATAATPLPLPPQLPVPLPVPLPAPAPTPTAAAPAPAVAKTGSPASMPAATAPDAAGRFVVQVGAYNDAERLKAARQRLDKLGFKSFTQDVETAGGKRTRVRVGPFTSRAEAEAAAARVKAAGLQANILSL
ncbi:MAG: SPOR domain-containing protein [Rubrivivax sp.]|nr:SPOR domain-containing protein [Rubrivivax sp.]